MNSTIKILLFLGLILITLQQGGFQCNVTGCQYCSMPNMCGQCQNNFILTLNTNTGAFYCNQLSCPSNCALCYQNNICTTCNTNFTLTMAGQCSTNSSQGSAIFIPSNCLWGNNFTSLNLISSCSLCAYGYTLQGGYCYPTITIKSYDSNCMIKMTSTYCQICQSGYIVNVYGKCVNNANYIGQCLINNCIVCTNNTSCATCASGYQKSTAAPYTCIQLPCNLTGCASCSNSTTCSSCMYGYILNSNTSLCQQLSSGCSLSNCKYCLNMGNGQSCSACNAGYQLIQQPMSGNYLCQPLPCPFNITNCSACVYKYDAVFHLGNVVCEANSCYSNYMNVYGYCVQNVSNAQPVCNNNTVPNCANCSYNNFCSMCNPGYALTRDGQCQVTQCNVMNCQSCSLNNICQQCNTGYQLNYGYFDRFLFKIIPQNLQMMLNIQCTPVNTSIVCNISNCQYCSLSNVCSQCAPGSILNTNNNTCTPTCNITNCYQCNTNNNSTMQCSICASGYMLSSNGSSCTLMNYTCVSSCNINSCVYNLNTQSAQCISCMDGYLLYNGTCYNKTCNIYGCDICAPWTTYLMCLKCSQGLVLSDGYCIVPNCDNNVTNCINCVQGGLCVACKVGYYIQNNTNGTNTCVAQSSVQSCNNIPHCTQCNGNNNTYCQVCALPYVAKNGQCKCNFQNCLDCSTSLYVCNQCPPPLFASLQDPNCLPQPSLSHTCNVNNCEQCFASNKCSVCSLGYTINKNDFSCTLNNCSALGIANCQLCDQFGYACHFCNTGYMIDNFIQGALKCYPINANYTCNITGCAVCSSTNNSICSSCLPSYTANGTTQCIPNSCNTSNCYLCLDSNNICTVCDTGYYLSSNLTCQPKFNNIVNCQGQIQYCDICVTGLVNTGTTPYCIKCQDGFQYLSILNLCIPQMNSIPNCKVQLPDYSNNNLPMCIVCEQGYFVNSFGLCSLFNPNITNTGCTVYNCLYCALNSTTCSFCFSPWGISSTGICQTSDPNICGSGTLTNCLSCLNSSYCVSCASTYIPYQGQCILCTTLGCTLCNSSNVCITCQSGYQLTNGLCISCNITNCNTCSNNNVCSQCLNGLVLSSTGGSCVMCNVTNCISCMSNNMCGICNNGYQLNMYTNLNNTQCIICNVSNCIACNNNNYCQVCATGYYPSNGICVTCNYPCATCSTNNTCLKCQTPYFVSNPSTNGSCYASTIPNCIMYSYNATGNPTNCTQCDSNYTVNYVNNTCDPICSSNCLTCTQTTNTTGSNSCLSCYPGFYYNQTNNTCTQCQSAGCTNCSMGVQTCYSCMDGFYLMSGECKPCNSYCAKCTSGTVCSSLVTPTSQVLVTINQITYLAICPQGCSTCSSLNPLICISCLNGFYLSSSGSNICMPCSQVCMTCSSSNSSTCLSCYPNSFLSGNTCIQCNSNCATCVQSNLNNCTSCYPGYYLSTNTSNTTCIFGCPSNCITCSSNNMCTQCASGYTLYQQSNSVICVQCVSNCRTCASNIPYACLQCGNGFYLYNGQCMACTTNCATCLSSTSCTKCISGYFLTSSLTCSPNCILPCATCSTNNPTKCASCIAGYSFNSLSYTCTPQLSCNGACTVCPIGSILINGLCNQCNSTNCQVCNSNNLTQCISCQPGYYINNNSQCMPCLSSCATCLRSDGCTTCASGYTANSLISIQPKGYQCLQCSYPCATCEINIDYCTSCVSGYQFNGWKCMQIFNFLFFVKLSANTSTFNANYNNFLQQLAGSIGSSNQNIVTITNITFSSVIVNGGVAPTALSGTLDANLQFGDIQSLLSLNNNIAGMKILASGITVTGGTVDYDKVDLGLILGICIPVGVLLIVGIILYIYKKNKKTIVIEDNINDQPKFNQRESFELSGSYKENNPNEADQTGRRL